MASLSVSHDQKLLTTTEIPDKMSKKKKLSPYKIDPSWGKDECSDCCQEESVIPAISSAVQNSKRHVESKEERDQRMKHQHANRSTKNGSKDAACGGILVESSPKKKRRERK